MAFFERTVDQIVSDSLEQLSANTNITQTSPGSKTRFLLDTVSREQGVQHAIFDANLMNAFIKYADSIFLDYLGDMLNLPRNESTLASDDTENFMFYVSSGTFGDINGGSNFTIPSGTLVSTVPYDGAIVTPGITSQAKIEYRTISPVVCQAGQSFVYVGVQAVVEGRNSDVPRNVLNKHPYTSYTLSSREGLKCTNRFSIANGRDRESDSSYRYRLANLFRARQMAVAASIRLAALSIAGVANIKELPCEQGPGSYSIYVQGLTSTTSPRLLEEVSAAVSLVSAHGVRPFVLAPIPIGLEFTAAISWSSRATSAQITAGQTDIRNALETTLNSMSIGEELVLRNLVDTLLQTNVYAMSIGDLLPNKFEEVYAYRIAPQGIGTIRSLVLGDSIVPLYNERIILETSNRFRGLQILSRS
jgi:uncharacterized phage protein gp47/JayE